MKHIDADYYGYRDEDDGRIIPLEQEMEKKVMAQKIREWKERKEPRPVGKPPLKLKWRLRRRSPCTRRKSMLR